MIANQRNEDKLFNKYKAYQDFLYLIIDRLVDIIVCVLQKIEKKKVKQSRNECVTFS